ncbi:MAG: hypothetical protein JWR19_697 [Pedosphaera sp.]|nr:hypothetical protein [Pedosphaera sp.]
MTTLKAAKRPPCERPAHMTVSHHKNTRAPASPLMTRAEALGRERVWGEGGCFPSDNSERRTQNSEHGISPSAPCGSTRARLSVPVVPFRPFRPFPQSTPTCRAISSRRSLDEGGSLGGGGSTTPRLNSHPKTRNAELQTLNFYFPYRSRGRFNHKPKPLDVARVARVAQLFVKKTAIIPFVYRLLMQFSLPISKIPPQIFQLRTPNSAPRTSSTLSFPIALPSCTCGEAGAMFS